MIFPSVISHAKFIRFGYSKRIPLQKLVLACEPIESSLIKICGSQSKMYSIVMLSLGFQRNEFKMGNDVIFMRSNKFHLLEEFMSETLSEQEANKLAINTFIFHYFNYSQFCRELSFQIHGSIEKN